MRHTLLIARREFVENAKTKGFWIGIFMLPVIFAIAIGISAWLARYSACVACASRCPARSSACDAR